MLTDGTKKQQISKFPFDASRYNDGWLYCMKSAGSIRFGNEVTFVPGLLYRMRLDGSEIMKYENSTHIVNFSLNDGWIYYILRKDESYGGIDRSLHKMRIDGSDNKLIAENCNIFIIADDYIFIQFNNKIIRSNIDGTASETIVENNNQIHTPIFTYNGYLYFSVSLRHPASGAQQIQRIKFDGTEQEIIVEISESHSIGGIIFNNGLIYYAYIDPSDIKILKINANGTDSVILLDNITRSVFSFRFFGDYIYYRNDHDVYRFPKNGGEIETVRIAPINTLDNQRFMSGWFISNSSFFIVDEPLF
jgi:hypothetical protein